MGYRHIETAQMYGNEKGTGEGVRASGLDRSQVVVTSKLHNGFHRPDDARRAFAATLADLDLGYVDEFLIHWPLPTRYDVMTVTGWSQRPRHRNHAVDHDGVGPRSARRTAAGHREQLVLGGRVSGHLDRGAEDPHRPPLLDVRLDLVP